MALADLEAISKVCRAKKVELVVDNTFMSPYFQQPIALGADMVVHSTTKFLNGHSDGLGGVVVCTRPEQTEQMSFVQKAVGAILSPFECWLVLRGVKTLAVRMEQHDRSGRVVAEFLARHKKVKKVFYPGLPDHPQYELAQKQMTGFGSMITFETGSLSNANKMLRKVRVCSLAESLGGVETLISHPATMTHAALGRKGKKTNRHHRWHGEDFSRHRERGRHHRRPGSSPGGHLSILPPIRAEVARRFTGDCFFIQRSSFT